MLVSVLPGDMVEVVLTEDGSVRENAFRICLSDPQLGDIMAGYAVDKLGYKKVAILYEITSEYSLGITNNFTDAFFFSCENKCLNFNAYR